MCLHVGAHITTCMLMPAEARVMGDPEGGVTDGCKSLYVDAGSWTKSSGRATKALRHSPAPGAAFCETVTGFLERRETRRLPCGQSLPFLFHRVLSRGNYESHNPSSKASKRSAAVSLAASQALSLARWRDWWLCKRHGNSHWFYFPSETWAARHIIQKPHLCGQGWIPRYRAWLRVLETGNLVSSSCSVLGL